MRTFRWFRLLRLEVVPGELAVGAMGYAGTVVLRVYMVADHGSQIVPFRLFMVDGR